MKQVANTYVTNPTSAGHALIANEVFAAAVPEPAEYVLMLTGLVLVMRRMRCIHRRRAGA